jgi:hypothetical protein
VPWQNTFDLYLAEAVPHAGVITSAYEPTQANRPREGTQAYNFAPYESIARLGVWSGADDPARPIPHLLLFARLQALRLSLAAITFMMKSHCAKRIWKWWRS